MRAIENKYHSLIRSAIEEQLLFEPDTETLNRKPLRQPAPFDATREIRFMGYSPKLQAILQAARKRFRSGAGIPHETFWKEVEAVNPGRRKKRSGMSKRRLDGNSAREQEAMEEP